VVGAVRSRVKTIDEIAEASVYFFTDAFDYEDKGVRKHFGKEGVAEVLTRARERLAILEPFTVENAEEAYQQLSEELGIKAGEVIHPTRMALSGRTMGPGLFELMIILGKEKSLARLQRAIDFIKECNTQAQTQN
jgi:glutamyl-tRNA synthetase